MIPRRQFLLSSSSAVLAGGLAGCAVSRKPYRLLEAQEAILLSALCELIIPTDDTPGAEWAHVVKFIDRQLVYHYQGFRETYRSGLAALERASVELHGSRFEQLSFEEQTLFVAQLEKGEIRLADWPATAQREFFRLVRGHTMQGYYGDPRHGGNREMVGWRSLGLEYPPLRGRDDYRFPKDRGTAASRIVASPADGVRP